MENRSLNVLVVILASTFFKIHVKLHVPHRTLQMRELYHVNNAHISAIHAQVFQIVLAVNQVISN